MALKILVDECTSCGDCKPVCPTKSITDKGGIFKINADTCTECEDGYDEPQCVSVCPGADNTIVFI
ncbi:4Fe-4S dicluster domain-containing protein [Pseudothauera rhizosphaerae]|uniref:4Fe-4S dicluster domain-containing protein n=1 Tax=Pseudothauera rhizosphaerae TaxID=2565932 RepID=A0A4S4AD11_9RHOO|nr:4Fe-4S dicluster domain-containing protein [Pseudothauera rhizosphaerae]THF56903.1 4Fe-4S dicluster domain-containing protein [Pseudothauera rhizosphaerae]